jgi:hypothetical protein
MEQAFPPADFREFIDSIQGANDMGNRFLASMELQEIPGLFSFTADVGSAKQGIQIAQAMLQRRRDLDAHYGWVLASDAELVYKSMGGKSDQGEEWARQWMRDVHEEYEKVGRAMLDAKLELETLVRRAES